MNQSTETPLSTYVARFELAVAFGPLVVTKDPAPLVNSGRGGVLAAGRREAAALVASFMAESKGGWTTREADVFRREFVEVCPELGEHDETDLAWFDATFAGLRDWKHAISDRLWAAALNDREYATRYTEEYVETAILLAKAACSIDDDLAPDVVAALDQFSALVHWFRQQMIEVKVADLDQFAAFLERSPVVTILPEDAEDADAARPAATVTTLPGLAKTAAALDPVERHREIDAIVGELHQLIGLASVKQKVRELTTLAEVMAMRRDAGLPVPDIGYHQVFLGNPGTGKTTVARLFGRVLAACGILSKGHVVEASRRDLVGEHVGETAQKTAAAFEDAVGGVLFIDEAYALVGEDRDFGPEAVATLVKMMEDRRDEVVVIAAGYPEPMLDFLAINPGLRSRFDHVLSFDDYSDAQLAAIFETFCRKFGYDCDPDVREAVRTWFAAQPRDAGFGNGRYARQLFERAVTRQASRIAPIAPVTREDLAHLVPDDIGAPVKESAAQMPGYL